MNQKKRASEARKDIFLQGYEQLLSEDRQDIVPYTIIRTWNKIKYNIREMLAPELMDRKRTYRILDIGCECGFDAFTLSKRFSDFNLEFVGIDIYPEKVDIANSRAKEKGFTNCAFKPGNAEELDFPSQSFDFIICSEVVEHLHRPKKALAGMHRILKKGGCLILTTPNPDNKMGLFIPKFVKRQWSQWLGEKGREPTGDEPHDYVYHIGERGIKEWVRMCNEAGFRVVGTRRSELVYGSEFFDRHEILMGLTVTLDGILDRFTHYFSWNVAIKARK